MITEGQQQVNSIMYRVTYVQTDEDAAEVRAAGVSPVNVWWLSHPQYGHVEGALFALGYRQNAMMDWWQLPQQADVVAVVS